MTNEPLTIQINVDTEAFNARLRESMALLVESIMQQRAHTVAATRAVLGLVEAVTIPPPALHSVRTIRLREE